MTLSYSQSIHLGLKACLSLTELAQRSFCGQVVRAANSIDPNPRTLLTEVDVRNASRTLLPGAYAEVHFDVKVTGQRLFLPIYALLFRPGGTMAVAVGPDSRVHLKKLAVGWDFGNSLEAFQGIAPTDRIVINPPDALKQVELVNLASRGAPGLDPSSCPSLQALKFQAVFLDSRISKIFPLFVLTTTLQACTVYLPRCTISPRSPSPGATWEG